MSDIQFVEGLRTFKPGERAPSYVIMEQKIDRKLLIEWLQARTEDEIKLVTKESQNGKYYTAVDDWKPDPNRPRQAATQQPSAPARQRAEASPRRAAAPPPAAFEDDIPF